MEDLRAGRAVSRRYRNRRIGEFLKELDLTEGRSTGVPKILRAMENNGSPPPEFESDEDRTYFLIRLPVHERAERDTGEVELTPHVTPQVTPQVERVIMAMRGDMLRADLMHSVGLKDRMHFVTEYLQPALDTGLLEMTIPTNPAAANNVTVSPISAGSSRPNWPPVMTTTGKSKTGERHRQPHRPDGPASPR